MRRFALILALPALLPGRVVAVVLIGLASACYHLAPDNARLTWDRAAMALAAWLVAHPLYRRRRT